MPLVEIELASVVWFAIYIVLSKTYAEPKLRKFKGFVQHMGRNCGIRATFRGGIY